jgi:lipoate-protein ligase B
MEAVRTLRALKVVWLGRIGYEQAWTLQRETAEEIKAGGPEALFLLEHEPVFTLGRNARREDVLLTPERLAQRNIMVVESDRGGKVTYHGPGQLVGYPIFKLAPAEQDLHRFLRQLEEVLIRALARSVALEAERRPGATGVWAAGKKLASLGVAVRNWVTFHGFALNVATDLEYFGRIVPCGLAPEVMSSVERLLGRPVDFGALQVAVVAATAAVFGRRVDAAPAS